MTKPKSRRGPSRSGPLQVTASSGYAIHGLGYLAYQPDGAVIFLSEIAEHFAIPASYLAKVFQALARNGLVASYRGAKGGYALARPAGEITLRDVVEIFEGPIQAHCSLGQGPCTNQQVCSVSARLAQAQRAFLEELETHTIEQVGREYQRLDELRKE